MVHLEAGVPAPVVFGLAAMLTPHIRPHELARRHAAPTVAIQGETLSM
jgi:hypothetical protein